MKYLNFLDYSQQKKLRCVFTVYFTLIVNLVGIFSILYLFIILKNIFRYLMGYTFF